MAAISPKPLRVGIMRTSPAALGLLLVLLCAGCGQAALGPASATPGAASSGASKTVVWNAGASALSQAERTLLQSAVADDLPPAPSGQHAEVETAATAGNWATIGLADVADAGSSIPTSGTYMMLAYRTGLIWHALKPTDGGFCQALKHAPKTLLSDAARTYYSGC